MKRKNKSWQFTVCSWQIMIAFFIASCLFPTADCQTLFLDSVLSRIEKNNPALLSYTNKIKSADELVHSAKAWEAPMTGVELGQNPYSFDFKNKSYEAMIFIQQWFPSGKRIHTNEEYLKS